MANDVVKQGRLKEIAARLEKGETVGSINDNLRRNWRVSWRTMERLIAEAKFVAMERQQKDAAIEEQVREKVVAQTAEMRIMGEREAQARLTAMADGTLAADKTYVTKDGPVTAKCLPSHKDIHNALVTLTKIHGGYYSKNKASANVPNVPTFMVKTEEEKRLIERV